VPVAFAAQPGQDGLPFTRPQGQQMADLGAHIALLFPVVPGGLRHLVLTHPGTEPSLRFLSVGSHLCARASSRQPLAELPLPSASSCFRPLRGHLRYSYRGLSPHKFTPMPGVYTQASSRRRFASLRG
jgi:hypothetical protein